MPMSPRNVPETIGAGGPGEVQESLKLPSTTPSDSEASPARARARPHPSYGIWICSDRPIPVRSAVESVSVACGTLQSRL